MFKMENIHLSDRVFHPLEASALMYYYYYYYPCYRLLYKDVSTLIFNLNNIFNCQCVMLLVKAITDVIILGQG